MTELTRKARLLLACIQEAGGGALEETAIRARVGFSHGSFSAARRELLLAGCIRMERSGRQAVYVVLDGHEAAGLPAVPLSCEERVAEVAADQAAPPAGGPQEMAAVFSAGEERQRAGMPEPASGPEIGRAVLSMPRVTGEFGSLDDWEMALTLELGDCLDVSESLTAPGEYLVYSHERDEAATYQVTLTESGVLVE